jgi:hypothetical protein
MRRKRSLFKGNKTEKELSGVIVLTSPYKLKQSETISPRFSPQPIWVFQAHWAESARPAEVLAG